MAAVLAAGAGAALSCLSSAVMRGWLNRSRLGRISVTTGRRVVCPDLNIHFSRHWNADDVVVFRGLPHTTGERLAIDLGGKLTRYQLTNIVKEAAFWGCFNPTTFESERNRLNNPPGSSTARRAIASFASGCAGTRSALEDRIIQLIDMAKLPLPDEAGMPIGPHETDLIWLDRGLIVEVDGPGHRQPNSRRKDPARDAHLRRAGFEVVRFTNYQIDGDPYGVVTHMERLLTRSA